MKSWTALIIVAYHCYMSPTVSVRMRPSRSIPSVSLSKYDLRTHHPYLNLNVAFEEGVRRRSFAKHPKRSERAKGEGWVGRFGLLCAALRADPYQNRTRFAASEQTMTSQDTPRFVGQQPAKVLIVRDRWTNFQ